MQLFNGIKFQCAMCGMRFVRNMLLKEHLDAHFTINLAIKRSKANPVSASQGQTSQEKAERGLWTKD